MTQSWSKKSIAIKSGSVDDDKGKHVQQITQSTDDPIVSKGNQSRTYLV